MSETLLLLAGGLLAGIVGGLLGLGGGIILMPLLRFGAGLSPAYAAGTCVLAVFFTTLGGSYRHARLGNLTIRPLIPVILSGGIAATVASMLFTRLAVRGRWIDFGIGLVFLLIAGRMLVEGIRRRRPDRTEMNRSKEIDGCPAARISIGAAAGALPGLLGIGSGGILVPAFTFLLRAPVKAAMAASLLCFCVNALISSLFKMSQGFIDPAVAVPACVGTAIGANIGAMLNRNMPSRALKLVFGLLFCYVSARFITAFLGAAI